MAALTRRDSNLTFWVYFPDSPVHTFFNPQGLPRLPPAENVARKYYLKMTRWGPAGPCQLSSTLASGSFFQTANYLPTHFANPWLDKIPIRQQPARRSLRCNVACKTHLQVTRGQPASSLQPFRMIPKCVLFPTRTTTSKAILNRGKLANACFFKPALQLSRPF